MAVDATDAADGASDEDADSDDNDNDIDRGNGDAKPRLRQRWSIATSNIVCGVIIPKRLRK